MLVCSTADLMNSIGEKNLPWGLPGVRSLENLYGIEWKSERASLQNQFSEETNFVPTASPTSKMQKNILTLFFVLSLASKSRTGKQS